MDNVVTINNTKTNVLELDVSVQGLDTADIRVWLSVLAEGVELCFECEREGYGEKWVVTVPPLPYITRTAYPCSVKIVADGYFFEPLIGTMNIVGSAEVYSTTPQNIELKPSMPDSEEEKEEVTEKVVALPPGRQPKSRAREKSIQQLAQELMEKRGVPGLVDDDNVIQIPVTKKAAEVQANKIVEDEERDRKSKLKSEDIDALIEKIKTDRKEEVILQPPEEVPVIEEVVVEEVPVVEAPIEEVVVEEPVDLGEAANEDPTIIQEEIDKEIIADLKTLGAVTEITEEVESEKSNEIDGAIVEAEAVEEVQKDDAVKDILKATKAKKRKKKRKPRKKVAIPKKEIAEFVQKPEPKPASDESAVKTIIEDARKKAKKYTKKKKAAAAEIPKKEIADFKLKPRKQPTVESQTKNDAIKAILEDLGVKLDSNRPTKFIVRSNATRGEAGYDIEEIAKELIEKSELDDEGVKKLEQLKEVVESEKDSEVMAILEEIGIKPKGAKDVPRVSFIKKDTH